jgi:hypothetical protein
MIKLCMDRMLPVSLFEKGAAARSAVTINITGIGESVSVGGESLDLGSIEPSMKTINGEHSLTIDGESHAINGAAHN